MTGTVGVEWRILLVEDDEELARTTAAGLQRRRVSSQGERATVDIVSRFDEALGQIRSRQYDLVVLDIRDEAAVDGSRNDDVVQGDVTPADRGLSLYSQIRSLRYVPIVFYSAVAHLAQDLHDPPFVTVVNKLEQEEDNVLRNAVTAVFDSPLPRLNRALAQHVDRVLLSFMIDFVEKNWPKLCDPARVADLAYLLARRLAHSLGAGRIDGLSDGAFPNVIDGKVHPTRLYVMPPIGEFTTGDLFRSATGGCSVLLTPACDLVLRERKQNGITERKPNADFVVMANCQPLAETHEYQNWLGSGRPESANNSSTQKLDQLLSNNRQGQKDRYYFLPAAWECPDLVVDLQRLSHLPYAELGKLERLATLDDPYAQSLVAQLGRYIGRMGTPDLDVAAVRGRLPGPALEREPNAIETG